MYADAAPIFQNLGCSLTAVSTSSSVGEFAPVLRKAGYEIKHLPLPRLRNYISRLGYYWRFIRLLKKNKYDVVHIHRNGVFWAMALCAWIANVKSVYTFHNVFNAPKAAYIYHWWLRWSAKNIFKCQFQTISDSVYNNELNYYHNKTTKIYNWYGSQRFFPGTKLEKMEIRKDLNISEDALVLISVGGCSHIKRHSEILKALPLILEKVPNCIYLHLGTGSIEQTEKDLVKRFSLEKHVIFCGNQKDVRKFLIASDIYLMPSKHEGIPITTIEAMGCKIPAILYDVPGLCDFNKQYETSLLIKEDYKKLAKNAVLLSKNIIKREELINNAKHFVDTNFSIKDNAERIFNLYK
jgi:glycosyltransferase involved in cell wall biosynthesis